MKEILHFILQQKKGNFEAFLLIKEKVDGINPKNEDGNTPLHRAALSEIDGAKKNR